MQSFAIWSLEGLGYRCWPSKYRAFWVLSVQSTYTWGHQQWTAASYIGGLCNSFRSCEILESFSYKKVSYLQIVRPVWIMVVTSSIWWEQQNYPQVNRCFRRLHPTNKQTLQKTASYCHHLRPFVMVTGGSGSVCWTWICWRKTSQNLQSQNGKILSRTEGNKSHYRGR